MVDAAMEGYKSTELPTADEGISLSQFTSSGKTQWRREAQQSVEALGLLQIATDFRVSGRQLVASALQWQERE
jgi:hypothetical protein